MATEEFPTSPRDPRFVEAVVGVAATAALAVYRALTNTGPTAEEIVVVLGPAWAAGEAARSGGGRGSDASVTVVVAGGVFATG